MKDNLAVKFFRGFAKIRPKRNITSFLFLLLVVFQILIGYWQFYNPNSVWFHDNSMLILIIFQLTITVGACMNHLAIFSNGGKMPVLGRGSVDDLHEKSHFFMGKKKVKLYYLCDLIRITVQKTPEKERVITISAGDIIIVLGVLSAIIFFVYSIFS